MPKATKLFLEKNLIDNRYKVVDSEGFVFGDGEKQSTAIQSARIVSDAPIYFGSGVAVADDRDVYSTEEIISELANLAGMKVRCAYDNQFRIIGYTMELVE